ncbi:MAG: FixH family protein [Paracoccus sp. (in: a-proteobacteria)]|nr:FixH family protein [Paracoccus sp. (in: a-proteobacteria)]
MMEFWRNLMPGQQALVLVVIAAALFITPFLLLARGKPLTGRTMLGVFVGMFTVIIAVNIVMAMTAVRSFPGVEVANSYVASQSFDRDRMAQQALGWTAEPSYGDGQLLLRITDAQGLPAPVQALRVTVSRPTQKRDDVSPEMHYSGGLWQADLDLAPGAWVVHLEADAPGGTTFRQRLSGFPGSTVEG